MGDILFSNNAAGALSADITDSATTLVLASGPESLFPSPTASQYSYMTLTDSSGNLEVVKLTERSGTSCTVVRGQDGTSARAWLAGDSVSVRLTAAALNQIAARLMSRAL